MKAVLLSIKPKYCELIANGKKTIEVRKNRPKLETPFKVYIYETKAYDTLFGKGKPKKLCVGGGSVIGEFVCDEIYKIDKDSVDFIYKTETEHTYFGYAKDVYGFDTCLTDKELLKYLNHKIGYAWHISNLVIYDKPKELSEFKRFCDGVTGCRGCEYYYEENDESQGHFEMCGCDNSRPLKRPPQSWCYVESEVEQ